MGAELMGDDSVEADGEIISMLIDALLHTGLQDFQVSVGEVDYFKGICEELALTPEQEDVIRDYISNKNFFAVKEYLHSENIDKQAIETIMQIEDLFGSVDVLKQARALSNHPTVKKALDRLTALYEVLCAYGVERYVNFDLGMLSNYQYYTGIIFKVYTHGIGNVVVSGGRYDKLLPYFGKNSPAIGFVVVIDDLMQALTRQKINIELPSKQILIVYDKENFLTALTDARIHREADHNVQLIPYEQGKTKEEYKMYAQNHRINHLIYLVK